MLPFPSTPKRPPRALLPFDSPFFAAPALAPYHSPTPVRDHHLVYPDLFSRRTLSAADSLLHLAASPAASPARLLYPSFESESSHSHGHSQSTQSTFPPSPLPSTPSRIIRASHPSAKVDVLDLSSHLFSSPSFRSPDRFALLDDPPLDSQSISVSPILRESDRALKAQQKDGDALPVVQTRTLPSLARFVATDDDTTNDTNSKIDHSDLPASSSPALTSNSLTSRPCSRSSLTSASPLSSMSSLSPSSVSLRKRSISLRPRRRPFDEAYESESGSSWHPGDWQPSPPKTRSRALASRRQATSARPPPPAATAVDASTSRTRVNAPRRTVNSSATRAEAEAWAPPSTKRARAPSPEDLPAPPKRRRIALPDSPDVPAPSSRGRSAKRPAYTQHSASAHASASRADPAEARRSFPANMPIHHAFPMFYHRFYVPEFGAEGGLQTASLIGATPNAPRSPFDLYTPRFVKGRGATKVGLCPICVEPPSRGGEGKKVWLSMKFSAFKVSQYAHGISPKGTPFSPPIAFQTVTRPNAGKNEKVVIEQGKCDKCRKWVNVEGIKDVGVKVKEIFWWKHAAVCHHGATLPHETDVFVHDAAFRRAAAATAPAAPASPAASTSSA